MHQLIKDRLEELLMVGGDPFTAPGLDTHLAGCPSCRGALEALRVQAELLRGLRPSESVEPGPAFYARVLERIEAQRKPSFWGAFLEPGFARNLVFASLVFLVLFGGYLASSEGAAPSPVSGPEVIMADTQPALPVVGADPQQDRDAILVTLTTYPE